MALKKKSKAGLTTASISNHFQVVEAYKTIRTNLQFALATHEKKTVVATSAEPAAGKSTTLANLGVVLGQAERKVLIIDADLRKPTQHKIFKVPNVSGLSNILSGFVAVEEALQKDVMSNVDLISAGAIPPNPSELLGSPQMAALLADMEEKYDYILLDVPPVGVVSDALTLIPSVAGLLLIVRQKQTTYDELNQASTAIRQNGGNLLGVIITNVNEQNKTYVSYRYRKHYRYRQEYYGSSNNTEQKNS